MGHRLLLGLLLATDLAFIAVHVVHTSTPYLASPLNSLERDRGYAEYFQYTKLYWIVLLSALLWLKHRAGLFAGWLVVFASLLVDDMFSVHESGGARAAAALGLAPVLGLRAQDVGELLVTAVAGIAILARLGLGHLRADPAARALSGRLLGMLAALACVGVGADMLHQAFADGAVGQTLVVLEDGGELLVVSAIVSIMVGAALAPPRAAVSASILAGALPTSQRAAAVTRLDAQRPG
jgi:hypothetical protein